MARANATRNADTQTTMIREEPVLDSIFPIRLLLFVRPVDSATSIPYEVDLKTSLEITMQDGVFTYTLALPDSNRLNPPVGSAYGDKSKE